jgi:methionyl-tRNA formyltransferase
MPLSVVIIGQSWLASEVVKQLHNTDGVELVAAIPERPGDRFHQAAEELGVPAVELGQVPACDLIVAAHCHNYLSDNIRIKAHLGVLAYHPSLLPRHRGKDAAHWTIAMRDPIAGGTVFWMDQGIDTGPIQAQRHCFVVPGDTPASLWRRALGPMGVELLKGVIDALLEGRLEASKAQDEAFATYEPPVFLQENKQHL